jgi:hypothetical protein
MGEQKALKVFSLTSTGPGMCSLTCAIKILREIFHKPARMASEVLKKQCSLTSRDLCKNWSPEHTIVVNANSSERYNKKEFSTAC